MEKCGLIGSLVAGKVVENIGARISIDSWDMIRNTIKNINYIMGDLFSDHIQFRQTWG